MYLYLCIQISAEKEVGKPEGVVRREGEKGKRRKKKKNKISIKVLQISK